MSQAPILCDVVNHGRLWDVNKQINHKGHIPTPDIISEIDLGAISHLKSSMV